MQDVKEDSAMYQARELAMSAQLVKEQKQGTRLTSELAVASRELEKRVEEADRLKGQLHDGEWERERQIRELERRLEQKDDDIEKLKQENEEQNLSIQVRTGMGTRMGNGDMLVFSSFQWAQQFTCHLLAHHICSASCLLFATYIAGPLADS
jgi:predicted RNase H-like nuclease (RuvC/YqgF family)